ncbi:MAG: LexA family protein [Chloroflexia bacterium]
MDIWMLDDRTWEFSRCPFTGHVTLWPREGVPARCVGEEEPEERAAPWTCPPVPVILAGRRHRPAAQARRIAVVGEVAAGRYDVTIAYRPPSEDREELLVPEENAFGQVFVLSVRGHSMCELGIRDGDYVLVRPQADVDNGDLVIAALADGTDPEGYVTLKRYYREAGRIRLQPANAAMAPIHLYPEGDRDPVVVLGKVIAVVRCGEEEE